MQDSFSPLDSPALLDAQADQAMNHDATDDAARDATVDTATARDATVDTATARDATVDTATARDATVDTATAEDATVDTTPPPDATVDASPTTTKLLWPIDCVPGQGCYSSIGFPDTDGDGQSYDCGSPGYTGHEGTDISISWQQMDLGVDVYAAAAGRVLWVFDGKYDRCPDADEPDCQAPSGSIGAGSSDGYVVCTPLGNFCGAGSCCCYWCFAGANVVVIRHPDTPGVFATRYDHLKKGSILVSAGDLVQAGQKIAEVGSAGNSSGPHLHFEVWGSGFYDPVEPWMGLCGPNSDESLWAYDPPWNSP